MWFKELLQTALDAVTKTWDGVGEAPHTMADGVSPRVHTSRTLHSNSLITCSAGSPFVDKYNCDVLIANPPVRIVCCSEHL